MKLIGKYVEIYDDENGRLYEGVVTDYIGDGLVFIEHPDWPVRIVSLSPSSLSDAYVFASKREAEAFHAKFKDQRNAQVVPLRP